MFEYISRYERLKAGEEYFSVNNDAEFEKQHPRHLKGTPKGGQFAKVYTEKDGMPRIDEVIGLRSALNTNLDVEDCESVLNGEIISFDYASARFNIVIYGYDCYKICSIIPID